MLRHSFVLHPMLLHRLWLYLVLPTITAKSEIINGETGWSTPAGQIFPEPFRSPSGALNFRILCVFPRCATVSCSRHCFCKASRFTSARKNCPGHLGILLGTLRTAPVGPGFAGALPEPLRSLNFRILCVFPRCATVSRSRHCFCKASWFTSARKNCPGDLGILLATLRPAPVGPGFAGALPEPLRGPKLPNAMRNPAPQLHAVRKHLFSSGHTQ